LTYSIKQYRTIWLSDIHLGTRGCKAEFLLDFLKHHESEYLYLVGDIIDGWRLKKSWYWTQYHNDVVQKILRKARKGTRVFYLPGNHDEVLRDYTQMQFGGIEVHDELIHTTVDGRKFLILHGDQFDGVVQYAKWLAILGDWAYDFSLMLNHFFNVVRRKLGYPYWSISAYLKHKVKNAVSFISTYEKTLAEEAARREVDGIICGHIHKAEIRYIGNILYCNDGDWVESCTALVEDWDGQLSIVHWTDNNNHLFSIKETKVHENPDSVRRMATTD
jgi:UDP-2,3-diacylglucosamine pyrophosphatase LpxH